MRLISTIAIIGVAAGLSAAACRSLEGSQTDPPPESNGQPGRRPTVGTGDGTVEHPLWCAGNLERPWYVLSDEATARRCALQIATVPECRATAQFGNCLVVSGTPAIHRATECACIGASFDDPGLRWVSQTRGLTPSP